VAYPEANSTADWYRSEYNYNYILNI
jgi:hypothetical protein